MQWASPVARGALAGKVRGTHAAVVHPLQPNAILIYGGYGSVESQWLNELAILHTGQQLFFELLTNLKDVDIYLSYLITSKCRG